MSATTAGIQRIVDKLVKAGINETELKEKINDLLSETEDLEDALEYAEDMRAEENLEDAIEEEELEDLIEARFNGEW